MKSWWEKSNEKKKVKTGEVKENNQESEVCPVAASNGRNNTVG
jgi:hypothetical protein